MAQTEDQHDGDEPQTDDGQQNSGASEQKGGKDKNKGRKMRPAVRLLLILLVVLTVLGVAFYLWLTADEVETDDAYTAGRIVSIAPHVSGYVVELAVNDNQYVHAGQVLFRIDARDWRAARDQAAAQLEEQMARLQAAKLNVLVAQKNFPGRLTEAQGQLASAEAQLYRAQTDWRRQHSIARAATSQQDIDYAKAALDQAQANVLQAQGNLQIAEPVEANIENSQAQSSSTTAQIRSAQAQLQTADLNLGWTVVRAPHDGWIAERSVEAGNYVSSGQKVMAIVEPEVWVTANYKETQLTRMRPGDPVTISVDAYPFLDLHGHVDSIQLGAGAAFSAFPPENATGNFVKIVQRVPVKILIDRGLDPNVPLGLGLSVVPTVTVK